MSPRGKEAAALGLHRFGFGPLGGSIAAIADDPRGAILADLDRPDAGRLNANLPSSGESARKVFDFRAEQAAKQKLALRAQKEVEAKDSVTQTNANVTECSKSAATPCVQLPPPKPAANPQPPLPQQLLQDEAKARFDAAVGADIGFVERLVWFWSNHFCISADKIVSMAGAFEREAIRPHVLGRFADLLQAVESHPGMLFYLDNVASMGANSTAGINRDRGLNENLAREILELHTLGVRSGYTQQDVTSFANVITGWTWIAPEEPAHGGEFVFSQRLHEPGDKVVLGKRYPDNGVGQGHAVLADVASHPATAQHIAEKLARHFVADDPPPSLIAKLAKTFTDTGGDLKEVSKTLIAADESWTPQRVKLKQPSEWVAGVLRLTATPEAIPVGRILGAQATLGEALWRPLAPNGYPDTEAAWIDGVPHRLDIANGFAGQLAANNGDPRTVLDNVLGPLASPETRETIARAESRPQALALLVMAPEFLRR